MKIITLTQGQFAIVDDENYERLVKHKWYAIYDKHTQSYRAVRSIKNKNGKSHMIYMAREILGLLHDDKRQADHINHITLDNRKSELRVVSQQENCWNRKNPKGYSFESGKYKAEIRLNGKKIYLGHFCTTKDAHNVYLLAKQKYHQIKKRIA